MKLPDLKPGKYVVAVSGGVDSLVLLDLLSNLVDLELIVAHFNHGIRPDAELDEELVKELAKKYQLIYEIGYGNLGSATSEETARNARYEFLTKIRDEHGADGIITAHHQDDLIETALINTLRGTGRRGLTALLENPDVIRPMTDVPKKEILDYAKKHNLHWREDTTNSETKYLRNYIRKFITPRLTEEQRDNLLRNIQKVAKNNQTLQQLIAIISQSIDKDKKIDRHLFISLPLEVEKELVHEWLRNYKVRDIDKSTVERLTIAIKTGAPGTSYPVKKDIKLVVERNEVYFTNSL